MADKKFTKEELADALVKKADEVKLLDDDALDNVAGGAGLCCNACVSTSPGCVPDKNPNKCEGGCTASSMLF